MSDSELSPIKQHQVSGFVMASVDLDSVELNLPLKTPSAANLANFRTAIGGLKTGTGRMASSMSQLGLLSGAMGEDVGKVIATVQLVSAGASILSALEAIYDLRTAAKIAEGIAHLAKYLVLAPVVAGFAIAAAVVFGEIISEQTRQFDFTGDYSTPAGTRLMQRQLEGTRW